MPKKLIVGDPARGLYKRGEKWWLYYRQDGKRIRVPLNTSDKREAIRAAGPLRGRPSESYAENPLVALGMRYVKAEEASSNFTPSTARSTEYAIKGVAARMKLSRTSEIHKGTSQAVYDLYQDKTEATARTLSMRFHAFLQWLFKHNYLAQEPGDVEFSKRRPVARREDHYTWDEINKIIAST